MNAMIQIQQYLFPEEAHPLSGVQAKLSRFRYTEKVQADFVRAVLAKVTAAGSGGLVAVGCSPAVKQDLIVSDVIKAIWPQQAASEPNGGSPVICVTAPPEVSGVTPQLRILHDRYRREADCLNIPYKFGPLFSTSSPRVTYRTTETEAVADLLMTREVKLVCVLNAENIATGALVNYLADIARQSGVPHVLFGRRKEMLCIPNEPWCRYPPKMVVQPVYDFGVKESYAEFISIIKGYDDLIKRCSNVRLTDRAKVLMMRVGGDPCRLSQWVCEALCEAARQMAPKLEWVHLERTGPRDAETEAALKDLNAYLGWSSFRSLDEPTQAAPASPTPRRQKPGVRNPVRDAVPPAA